MGVYTALVYTQMHDRIMTLFLDKRMHGRALLSRRFRILRLCDDSSQRQATWRGGES